MTRLSRRNVLAGGLALAALTACSNDTVMADPAEPLPPVEDRIGALERRYNALIGVFAVNLDSGRTIAHRAQDSFAMCSTFKTYAAARALQMIERGELSLTLDSKMVVEPSAVVANSPITGPRAGTEMTVAELCRAALQRSDNTAGNMLLRWIQGPPAVTAFARSIGDERSRLDRWEVELNSAAPGDPRDTSSPEALAGGYRALLVGNVLAEPQRRQLEDWMRGNETSSMRAGLPPGWTSADKTGSGDYGSSNDVGIVYGPEGQRLLLGLMTRSAADDPKAASMRPVIGELAALLVPALLS